jgi:hypothetical protein
VRDLERAYDLKSALTARGVDAFVSDAFVSWRMLRRPSWLRIAVAERDLVYARWIAASLGFDAWPEPEAG